MLCNGTWGQEEEEGDIVANTAEGGIGGAEEGGGDITRALVVITPTLGMDVAMVDEDTTMEPAEVVDALTLTAVVTS